MTLRSYPCMFGWKSRLGVKFSCKQIYYAVAPLVTHTQCLKSGISCEFRIYCGAELIITDSNKDRNEASNNYLTLRWSKIHLCNIPLLSSTGTVVVRGLERVLLPCLSRLWGVVFAEEGCKFEDVKIA